MKRAVGEHLRATSAYSSQDDATPIGRRRVGRSFPIHDLETRYAVSSDGHVAYQVIGDGPRDLVFVPNWGSNVDVMWEEPSLAHFLRRLATFSRLLCFDKRGTGVSDPVTLDALPTLEQWMEDVRSVMNAVGSSRTVLLGDSEGGQMAMLFAATYPERVSALILTNTAARHLRDVDYPWGLPARSVEPFLQKMRELWGTGGLVELMAPSAAQDERFRRWYGRYERSSLPPRAINAYYVSQLQRDLRSVLPTIQVPTLVLHRVGNRHMRVGHGRYLAEHIPGAKYVELPGDEQFFHSGDTEMMLGEIEEFLTGIRPAAEFDRVLSTVLFTDIVDSTEHAAVLGDRAWRALLDTHNDIVRRELGRHRGQEIKSSGDGFLATFDGPARAVRCAGAIIEAVHGLGLHVRCGVHTGEVEMMGDDIGGIAVHIASRIAALADGREVLVSRTVRDLVAGSNLHLEDRGAFALKGLSERMPLFAAVGSQRA